MNIGQKTGKLFTCALLGNNSYIDHDEHWVETAALDYFRRRREKNWRRKDLAFSRSLNELTNESAECPGFFQKSIYYIHTLSCTPVPYSTVQ